MTASFANRIADIKELRSRTRRQASALGTLALGDAGASNLQYDVAVTNLEPLAKRFNSHLPDRLTSSARRRTGVEPDVGRYAWRQPPSLQHKCRRLTANSKYTIEVPHSISYRRASKPRPPTFVTVADESAAGDGEDTYEKNELEFNTMVEEERRSLGLGGNVMFHPTITSCTCAR